MLGSTAKPLSDELDYKASMIKYYHSGAQVDIKINNLPYNTAQVMISPVNTAKKPKIYIIGKRRLKVDTDDSVKFTVRLEDLKPGTYNTRSSELSLVLYSYNNDKLEQDEKAKLYIRPIICSAEGEGICATVEKECHKGQQNCQDSIEKRTFTNRCEMKKHQALFLHNGECAPEE